MLRLIEGLLESLSVSAGFYGAWLWFRASKVSVQPGPGIDAGLPDSQRDAWIDALLRAGRQSADLNKQAALVTGIAAAAQGALALLARINLS